MDSAIPLDLIKRYGVSAILRRESRSAADSAKPWRNDSPNAHVDFPCSVVFDQIITYSTDGIAQTYEVAYIPAKDLGTVPQFGDVIISEGTRATIQTQTKYSPDNVDLLYELRITK